MNLSRILADMRLRRTSWFAPSWCSSSTCVYSTGQCVAALCAVSKRDCVM